eukprot:TRINITY_DN112_c0_g1_i6.p1 TRINITY_DN112_c0_g1~~TRINITY_DN112_c0_g1_i6.p1  ORF type:complete len:197 (-),score=28.73 TRINITY_DN112_c0_g1_i6:561-1151(-)
MLTYVDTPGFGDTRGIGVDKEHTEKIVDAIKIAKKINCIVLVINGREARVTATLKYVIAQITSILPRQISGHVVVLFTNCASVLDRNFDFSVIQDLFPNSKLQAFHIDNPFCKLEKVRNAKSHGFSEDEMKSVYDSLEEAFFKSVTEIQKLHSTLYGLLQFQQMTSSGYSRNDKKYSSKSLSCCGTMISWLKRSKD